MHLLLPLIADLELLTKKFLLDMKEIATYLALISLQHGSIAFVIMIVGVMTTKIVSLSLLFHQITRLYVRDSLHLVPAILTHDLPAVVVVVVVATGVSVVSVDPPLLQDGRVMSAAPVTAYDHHFNVYVCLLSTLCNHHYYL